MDLRESIANQTAFSLRLAKHVGSIAAGESNLVFSPLSLHVALSLLATGAKGPTLDQLLSFLGSGSGSASASDLTTLSSQIVELVLADGSPSGGPRVAFANGVWFDESLSLKSSFKETVSSVYKAETNTVDFKTKPTESAQQVNTWVEKSTTGLIKELLPPGSVDPNTRLILTNALYFKGNWTEKFDPSQTNQEQFYLLDGTTIQSNFMSTNKKQYISSYDNFSVLGLPYNQGSDKRQFSMYIFLPESRTGIWDLTEKLFSDPNFLTHHIPRQKVSVGKFKLPKFKISFGFESSEILKGMGLELPFKGNGDLTEMVDSSVGQNLYVSSVHHKSFIEVNEEGTEAAAASAVKVALRSLPVGPADFVADHPFLFFIREDMTGVVLFVGHVLNPLVEG